MTDHGTTDLPNDALSALNDALEAAGIYVAVEQRAGALVLSGEVETAEMHEAALDLAQAVAEPRRMEIEDALEVLEIQPDVVSDAHAEGAGSDVFPGDSETISDVGTVDAGQAMDEAVPYFPPTDPVIGEQLFEQDEVEVIGGFQTTSLQGDDDEDARRSVRGDEQISDDVRRELREDATTTDLVIRVETRNGVVVLLGEVQTLEDAENAEAVAGGVPGVVEVREELTILGLEADRNR